MQSLYPASTHYRQRGFSFFEVLIAALILGVGVLGFAGLQVRALDSTNVAYFRSQATTLATDLAERIRVFNEGSINYGTGPRPTPVRGPGLATYPYSAYLTASYWSNASTPLPAGNPYDSSWNGKTCYSSTLTRVCDKTPYPYPSPTSTTLYPETGLVRADIIEMRYLAQTLLPGGNMHVRLCDGATVGNVCVYVGWQGIDASNNAQCQLGKLNDRCVVVQVFF